MCVCVCLELSAVSSWRKRAKQRKSSSSSLFTPVSHPASPLLQIKQKEKGTGKNFLFHLSLFFLLPDAGTFFHMCILRRDLKNIILASVADLQCRNCIELCRLRLRSRYHTAAIYFLFFCPQCLPRWTFFSAGVGAQIRKKLKLHNTDFRNDLKYFS